MPLSSANILTVCKLLIHSRDLASATYSIELQYRQRARRSTHSGVASIRASHDTQYVSPLGQHRNIRTKCIRVSRRRARLIISRRSSPCDAPQWARNEPADDVLAPANHPLRKRCTNSDNRPRLLGLWPVLLSRRRSRDRYSAGVGAAITALSVAHPFNQPTTGQHGSRNQVCALARLRGLRSADVEDLMCGDEYGLCMQWCDVH